MVLPECAIKRYTNEYLMNDILLDVLENFNNHQIDTGNCNLINI